MSHAVVLVALHEEVSLREALKNTPDGRAAYRRVIEKAVAHQMQPFDESGTMFADGSRWDWWQIGGRWTGFLSGYDPAKDEANWSTCSRCNGTGKRPDKEVANGCNGCAGTGRSLNFSFVDHEGDIIRKGDVKWDELRTQAEVEATLRYDRFEDVRKGRRWRTWEQVRTDCGYVDVPWSASSDELRAKNDAAIDMARELYRSQDVLIDARKVREFSWDIDKFAVPRDVYVRRAGARATSTFAFLKDRKWNEHERMGWFGSAAATECERAGQAKTHVCLHRDPESGAQIVSWNGAENWDEKFFERFIAPLPDDTILVVVDYHV